MVQLIKHQTVLHRHPDQNSYHFVYFEAKEEGEYRTDGYYMTRQTWEDAGRPEVITLTAEFGDKLNEDPSHG